jgi:PAS domain S-box-containing protein
MTFEKFNNNSSSFRNWLVKPKSIKISILVLFVCIASIATYIVCQQYIKTGANLLSADKASAALIARTIQDHNNKLLESLTFYAQKQSFIDAVKKRDVAEARSQLTLLEKSNNFNMALVSDKRGMLWSNFPAAPVGYSISYRDWYKEVIVKWKPHVSGIFQIMTADNPLAVSFSVPVFDENANPIGILAVYEKLGFIADTVKLASFDQNTTVYIIDQTGNILFDSKSFLQKQVTGYSLFPVIKKALAENKKQIEIKNQETNQDANYLSFAELEITGWLVIVQRDIQDNLSSRKTSNPVAIIIILALLFIILSLSLIYFRNIIVLKNRHEQMLSEIKLLESENIEREIRYNLESRVTHTNPPLIVWDHGLTVVRFDRAFEETTGWSKEEVLGKKIDLLLPENSKKESLDRISISATNENSGILEVPILHANGKTSTVHGHYITARKQAKQDVSILDGKMERRILERTGNLEAINRQLEAFSYSISHALLTPLQNIEKLCDTLKENDHEKMDEVERNYLEQISKETTRMGQLISDMRKLSHLNRSEISRQSVDVSKIVREIMDDFKQKYPEREVAVTIEKDVVIGCDELLLKIVLESLIDNAWKFTASKERAVIKFGTTMQDIKPVLFIRDNGIGFDLAQAHKLFSTFNRVDSRTGLPVAGIGLAKVQRIIDRHGGEIWAASKPGKGTTFYFTLSQ